MTLAPQNTNISRPTGVGGVEVVIIITGARV
jgi:hypothetical protein